MPQVTEQELKEHAQKRHGARVTAQDVDAAILTWQFHRFPGTMVTVCCIHMQNDFNVVGESACADPAMFDEDIGRRLAFDDAKRKIWPLLGYQLREQLHAAGSTAPV